MQEKKEDDDDKSEPQLETEEPVRYFFENDETDGVRNGCAFVELCVCAEARARYALVGPTPISGGVIVCTAAAIVPCDPDRFGVQMKAVAPRIPTW